MSQYTPGIVKSIKASGTINPNRFVGFDGAQCGAGKKALGVSIFGADDGRACDVVITGTAVVEAGGAISVGDPITSDGEGRAIKADDVVVSVDAGATTVTSTAANGDITTVTGGALPQAINGYAMEAASGAGEKIEIRLV